MIPILLASVVAALLVLLIRRVRSNASEARELERSALATLEKVREMAALVDASSKALPTQAPDVGVFLLLIRAMAYFLEYGGLVWLLRASPRRFESDDLKVKNVQVLKADLDRCLLNAMDAAEIAINEHALDNDIYLMTATMVEEVGAAIDSHDQDALMSTRSADHVLYRPARAG